MPERGVERHLSVGVDVGQVPERVDEVDRSVSHDAARNVRAIPPSSCSEAGSVPREYPGLGRWRPQRGIAHPSSSSDCIAAHTRFPNTAIVPRPSR
jgi:hypothetical protein